MVPISYNVQSLFARRATSLATLLGIALVVLVLASTLMFADGIKKTLASTGRDDKAFVLSKGSDAELSSVIDQAAANVALAAPGVRREGSEPLAVGEVVVVTAMSKRGGEGHVSNVQFRGVPDSVMKFRPEVRLLEGRLARPGTNEVIIGQRIRGQFDGLEMNQIFELKKNRPVTVVGVFEAGGTAFESEVWVDREILRTSFGRENLFSSLTVQLDAASAFNTFKAEIESDSRAGLEAMTEKQYYEKQSEGTATFVMVIGIMIAVFFSIGAMIGATITMYGAVSARQREIGTLRAIGFSRSSIVFSFMFESLALALLGGIIGALLSLPLSLVKLSLMNFSTWSEAVFTFNPSFSVILTAVLFGCGMGTIGGIFPALRAALISPLDALRN